ncbi:MAG: hypothetical protein EOM66_11480 [Clostridia bacterium]|nr:hypothetical protein [Clostridia bacterium]
MIGCFRGSRLVRDAGCILSAGLSTYLFVGRPQMPLWINGLSATLTLALGFVLFRLAANVIASNTNTKILEILHVQMDPQRFLNQYEKIPAKLKRGSVNHAVTTIYLADGYAAKGDYDTAERLVDAEPVDNADEKLHAAIAAIRMNARVDYALLRGDSAEGERLLSEFRQVLKQGEAVNPSLAANMQDRVILYAQWLQVMGGAPTGENFLQDMLGRTPVLLQRLEILWVMARSFLLRDESAAAREQFETIASQGGKTHFTADAKAALAKLSKLA